MNESNTWEFLRDVALPLGHYTRIESHDTAPGFPDVHYSTQWSTGTIELKYAKNIDPPFPADPDKGGLRQTQLQWIREEVDQGGVVWIMAEIPRRTLEGQKTPIDVGGKANMILILPGSAVDEFNGASLSKLMDLASGWIWRDNPEGAAATLEFLFNG